MQAVTIATLGPFKPRIIERLPEIILMIVPGMKKGETFRGPPSSKVSLVDSIKFIPPMPEPIETPILSAFYSVMIIPESLNASIPATNPN